MARIENRVIEKTDGDGLNNLLLAGPLKNNHSFDIFGTDTFFYVVDLAEGLEWESGVGRVLRVDRDRFLVREEVLHSSNGNQPVDFSSGHKTVFCDLPAEYLAKAVTSVPRRLSYFLGS